MVTYLALYQCKDFTLLIEYEPMDGGAIDITHIDIQPRPVSDFEQRERRRATQRLYNEMDTPTATPAHKNVLLLYENGKPKGNMPSRAKTERIFYRL